MAKYTQRSDGEWFTVDRSGHKIGCCDCGLVHKFCFRIKNGKLQMQAFRDNRATAQKRRWCRERV